MEAPQPFVYEESDNIRLVRVWLFMHQRCYYPKHNGFSAYGARGIIICNDWLDNFEAFRCWALANGWRRGLEIDRIDNDKGYSPENCRCVTPAENHRNRSNNIHVTAFGETKCVQDWVADPRFSISHQQLCRRIRKGIAPEVALTMRSIKTYFRSATERECSSCGKIKPRSQFASQNKYREPNHAKCKECEARLAHRPGTKTYKKLYKGEAERECGMCGDIKPNSEFYPAGKKRPDKPGSWCKVCMNKHSREYQRKKRESDNR